MQAKAGLSTSGGAAAAQSRPPDSSPRSDLARAAIDANTAALFVSSEQQRFSLQGPPAPEPPQAGNTTIDLGSVPERHWAVARSRYEAIAPLLSAGDRTAAEVERRAQALGRHKATLYRWLQAYRAGGTLTALLPAAYGAAPGQHRLAEPVEQMVADLVKTRYLTPQRVKISQIAREVRVRCQTLGLTPPHEATLRRRIRAVPEFVTVSAREGARAAQERLAPVPGHFPGADAPLRVVQIDHTLADLELVDDVHRRPIGRPWLTLAIDVYSRMVAGFSVSLDPPSSLSVGLCLTHAILPKELWLARHGLAGSWPVCGLMDAVHCDNAKEFHGAMLQKACENYAIELLFRPVQRPHYGGHIERLLGTLATAIHTLPGTTFRSPTERSGYASEKQAALTLAEFETWLAVQIVEVYHQRPHSALGVPPLVQYTKGLKGEEGTVGGRQPRTCPEETKLRLDFLPCFERTVQRTGLSLDEIHYFSDVLRRWIEAPDPADPAKKRRFLVRRDPRDLSVVYFYDPEAQQYFRIPYRNRAHPPLSLWELREIRHRLREEGQTSVDEALVFAAYERQRALEQKAVRETKAARRQQQRRRLHQQLERPPLAERTNARCPPASELQPLADILPFDEIEMLP